MNLYVYSGRLGDYLLEKGWLSHEQLQVAVDEQRRTGRRLGEVLVSSGAITRQQLQRAISAQMRVDVWDLRNMPPDNAVARRVPERLAKQHMVLPLREVADRVDVGMVDPTDLDALEQVQMVLRQPVRVVLVDEADMREAIGRIFGLLQTAEQAAKALPGKPAPAEGEGARPAADEADEPVVAFVQNLLEQAVRLGASDVHIEPGPDKVRIRLRVDGVLQTVMESPFGLHGRVVSRLKVLSGMDIGERRLPQDGRFAVQIAGRSLDCRCATMPLAHGEKMVIRLLDKHGGALSIRSLGLPEHVVESVQRVLHMPHGLFLVVGPTGSGKSTTLAACLQEYDRERLNVMTVEDPIEYEIPHVSQSQINPKAGLTFESALIHFLRQDPDVIMVGEIRDQATAELAVRAALTGHIVLSTLHTNDAASTVSRLVDMGVNPFLIASALRGVFSQRLVRLVCPYCGEEYEPSTSLRVLLMALGVESGNPLRRAVGCAECHDGYLHRAAVGEFLEMTPRLAAAIGDHQSAEVLREIAIDEGMRPLHVAGLQLAAEGRTTVEEVLRVTSEVQWREPQESGVQ